MEKKELTPEQALEFIGSALAHDTLKLSQKEHMLLIESFNILKDILKSNRLNEENNNKKD